METLCNKFDRMNDLISTGQAAQTSILLMGYLGAMRERSDAWPSAVTALRSHPLHEQLLGDPFNRRCFEKPRGYAGDAKMIDLIYHREAPEGTTGIGQDLFSVTIDFQTAEAVRLRRDLAEKELLSAHKAGKRILSLACGHFREGSTLTGKNLENVTLVDQDSLSLAVVRQDHGDNIHIVEANVIRFLRQASQCGEKWDYIYTLGLTDYFDEHGVRPFGDGRVAITGLGSAIGIWGFLMRGRVRPVSGAQQPRDVSIGSDRPQCSDWRNAGYGQIDWPNLRRSHHDASVYPYKT